MSNEKVLVATLGESLAPLGFEQRKKTWFLGTEETMLLVDLQKSDFGGQYYINLGVSIRCLDANTRPAIHKCHISERLDQLVPEHIRLKEALDLERTDRVEARKSIINNAVVMYGIPFLKKCESLDKIRNCLVKNELYGAAVWAIVFDACGLQPPP